MYIVDHPTAGLNSDTIDVQQSWATVHVLAAIQRWNEAATSAPRLVFAGFQPDPDPVAWADNSITVVAVDQDDIAGFIGHAKTMDSEIEDSYPGSNPENRMRIAIARRKWHTNPDSTETDLQNTLVHEFGHHLGLGHPWNALELDLDVPGSVPLYCRYAIGPQGITPGATVGVMSYFYLLGDEPNDGTGRSPWRDDIEGVTIAHGERALAGSTCRANDECDDCPPEDPECNASERVCVRVDSSSDACQVDADCPVEEFCEYVVQGPDTDRPDLDSCGGDDDCKSGYDCDGPSGKCVQDEGRCVHRECAVHLPEASTVAYWETSAMSHDWMGPSLCRCPGAASPRG